MLGKAAPQLKKDGTSLDRQITAAAYTLNVMRAVVSRGLNRNVVIFLKVNPSVATGEQLTADEQNKNSVQIRQMSRKKNVLCVLVTKKIKK